MTPEEHAEHLADQVRAARGRVEDAERVLAGLKKQLAQAETLAAASATPVTAMALHDLSEHVADLARLHGAQCGVRGHADTTPAWRQFRLALDELRRRASAGS